jgi:hypothetical protein
MEMETPVKSIWTPEELEKALRVEPMTGAEMIAAGVVGGWAEEGISSGEEWVEEKRRERHERLQW